MSLLKEISCFSPHTQAPVVDSFAGSCDQGQLSPLCPSQEQITAQVSASGEGFTSNSTIMNRRREGGFGGRSYPGHFEQITGKLGACPLPSCSLSGVQEGLSRSLGRTLERCRCHKQNNGHKSRAKVGMGVCLWNSSTVSADFMTMSTKVTRKCATFWRTPQFQPFHMGNHTWG